MATALHIMVFLVGLCALEAVRFREEWPPAAQPYGPSDDDAYESPPNSQDWEEGERLRQESQSFMDSLHTPMWALPEALFEQNPDVSHPIYGANATLVQIDAHQRAKRSLQSLCLQPIYDRLFVRADDYCAPGRPEVDQVEADSKVRRRGEAGGVPGEHDPDGAQDSAGVDPGPGTQAEASDTSGSASSGAGSRRSGSGSCNAGSSSSSGLEAQENNANIANVGNQNPALEKGFHDSKANVIDLSAMD